MADPQLTAPGNRAAAETRLEPHRSELTAHCYRMLGSPFEAEDAVQETMIRAWRGLERFEGRAQLRSWMYRIATNVCLDMLQGRERRALPMDLGPSTQTPETTAISERSEATWLQPIPDALVALDGDPAEVAVGRESIRLAFVGALQHLPPRQRAVLIFCEVLRWRAAEVAELLETSVASVNSALQRARATLDELDVSSETPAELGPREREVLARFVDAFERYDMDALTAVIREDASQSMPPIEQWLDGREHILRFWFSQGLPCRGSKILPTAGANGLPAFGQYKPRPDGRPGWDPWALQVLEPAEGGIARMTFFLDTDALFPLFGLPPSIDA